MESDIALAVPQYIKGLIYNCCTAPYPLLSSTTWAASATFWPQTLEENVIVHVQTVEIIIFE